MSLAVVRLRGKSDLRHEVKDTLRMLHLTRQNHCTILPADETFRGMLRVVKDHVTWGEIDPEVLAKLLLRRGRAVGDRVIDDAYVKKNSRFKSIWDLSQAIAKGEARLVDVKDLRPVLRLPPPRRGFRAIKRGYHDGGDLGYRGNAINELLRRMLPEEAGQDAV
uniref:Large ribosomal subunit protein uL30 n=1 Tax=uncultured euryarchaeote Rifle_16ft_4_minimus_309 TaxID=1665192 RepID=A0A0H4T2V9_9EURY|nr:ribosomal protein L30P, large subunit ribosomal protein L30 [uncultured euryarchaeote Rifle_16ft_4_minimus_309]